MDEYEPQQSKEWRVGFYAGPLEIKMEEEAEEAPRQRSETLPYGRVQAATNNSADSKSAAIERILVERQKILESTDTSANKLKMLAETRQAMMILRGGNPYTFGTEKVIYSILIFSGFTIIVLAGLTAFADLPKEVTISFVGTVVGGTIATIAQKLGKVGS